MNELCQKVKEQLGESHVMLSYNWTSSQQLCQKVYDSLTHYGLPIWMDKAGGIHGSIAGSMADAVENAAVIIPFMSEQYQESKACNQEIEYANDLGIDIVPIRAQKTRSDGKPYKATGRLGIITAGKLYVDFTNPEKYVQQVESLLIQIASTVIDPEDVMNIMQKAKEENGGVNDDSDFDKRIPITVVTVDIDLESKDDEYKETSFDGPILSVSILRKRGPVPCVYANTFGFVGNRVWIDKGAKGRFRVVYTKSIYIKVINLEQTEETLRFYSVRNRFREKVLHRKIADVILVKTISKAPCIKSETFGFHDNKIWIDKGARGVFKVIFE